MEAIATSWKANGFTPATVKVEMTAETARILSEFAFNGVLEMVRNMEPGGTECGKAIADFIASLEGAGITSCVSDMIGQIDPI